MSVTGVAKAPVVWPSNLISPRGSSPSSIAHRASRSTSAIPVARRSREPSRTSRNTVPSSRADASSAFSWTFDSFSARPSNAAPPSRVDTRVLRIPAENVAGATSEMRPAARPMSMLMPGIRSVRSVCASWTSTLKPGATRRAISSAAGSPPRESDDSGRLVRPSPPRTICIRPLVTAISSRAIMPVSTRRASAARK